MAADQVPMVDESVEDAYLDAMDSLWLYSASHPEWKKVYDSIIQYTIALRGLPTREPGT
jgi:hypothetical protein